MNHGRSWGGASFIEERKVRSMRKSTSPPLFSACGPRFFSSPSFWLRPCWWRSSSICRLFRGFLGPLLSWLADLLRGAGRSGSVDSSGLVAWLRSEAAPGRARFAECRRCGGTFRRALRRERTFARSLPRHPDAAFGGVFSVGVDASGGGLPGPGPEVVPPLSGKALSLLGGIGAAAAGDHRFAAVTISIIAAITVTLTNFPGRSRPRLLRSSRRWSGRSSRRGWGWVETGPVAVLVLFCLWSHLLARGFHPFPAWVYRCPSTSFVSFSRRPLPRRPRRRRFFSVRSASRASSSALSFSSSRFDDFAGNV